MKRALFVIAAITAAGCANQQKVATREPIPESAPAPVATTETAPAPAPEKAAPQFTGAIIHFAFNESSLTPESMDTLRSLSETMRANEVLKVRIAGHADERGTTEYNLALGNRRADAARKYLVDLGVPADRVSIISYGEEMPAVQGDSEEAFAANRRGELTPQ